jgi:hypothetical protein
MENVFGGIISGILEKLAVSLSQVTRNESETIKHKSEKIQL